MLRIVEYNNGVVSFHCENCNNIGVYSFADKITADCAFIVEPSCQCGNKGKVYFLYCSTEAIAKELLAEFESLKFK